MPKVDASHMQLQRSQILEAARRCFSRKGIHPTTIRGICAEASLSIGGLYTHFRSKSDIIEALLDQGDADNTRLLDTKPDGTLEIEPFLQNAIPAIADPANREQLRMSLLFQAEALHNAYIAERMQRQHAALVAHLVASMTHTHGATPRDAKTRAILILSAIEGLKPQLLADPELDVDAYVRLTLERVAP